MGSVSAGSSLSRDGIAVRVPASAGNVDLHVAERVQIATDADGLDAFELTELRTQSVGIECPSGLEQRRPMLREPSRRGTLCVRCRPYDYVIMGTEEQIGRAHA